MIEVKTNVGWRPYCDEQVKTDIRDMNGVTLYTGDVVEILYKPYYDAGIKDCQTSDTAMIVFDQRKRYISTDKFFVEGWLDQDWEDETENYLLRIVDRTKHNPKSHYRIV